jgi:raffinose/stachyose/melibiose transport system substrate-binding protein
VTIPTPVRAPRRWLVVAAVLLVGGVACTPGGATHPATAPPKPSATGVTETGPVTLTVWDQESGKVSKVWEQLNAGFEAKYPNVTIKRVNRSFGDLKSLLKLAISGPNAPDVVEANQGWPDMGEMVKAGLLLPLDNYAQAYGWLDRVPENVNAANSFTPDGKRFGTGSLFGFTSEGELIGVFYNKDTLAKLGLSVPTTLADFVHDLAVAKQGGEIPIQFGNLDGFPGIHEWGVVQDQIAPESTLTDFIFGLQGNHLSFNTPENVRAATMLQDWVRKGYFTDGLNAVGYDDAVANFAKGQGLFMITGNWIVANLGADSTKFGFFTLPPEQAGGPAVSTGGPGFPLSITAKSEHPDVAAAYIDWMTDQHATDLLVPTGQIPLTIGYQPSVEPGTLLSDVLTAAGKVNGDNGMVPYEDWSTPTFYNTLSASVQELMGLRITPRQFVVKVEDDYAKFQKSRN